MSFPHSSHEHTVSTQSLFVLMGKKLPAISLKLLAIGQIPDPPALHAHAGSVMPD